MAKSTGGYTSLKNSSLYNAPPQFIDTGNALLNWAICSKSGGGYPKGKIIEIFGDPATGKSLLACTALANVQKNGGIAILDDVEYSFNPEFASLLGLDSQNNFCIGNSTTIEAFGSSVQEKIEELQKAGVKEALFVLDSIANLSTVHEEESPIETRDMTKAYFTRKIMRILTPLFASSNYTLIALNHLVSNIGNMYVPKTATGGSGLKFLSSVRVELSYAGKYPPEKKAVTEGVFTRFYVSKNRIAPPFRGGTIYIDFQKGVSRYSGLLNQLIEYEIAEHPKGSRKVIINGKEFTRTGFEENFEEIASNIYKDKTPNEVIDILLGSRSNVVVEEVDEE